MNTSTKTTENTATHFDDEYYKVHKLKDGYYIKEDWKGRLSPISKVDFEFAFSITHLFFQAYRSGQARQIIGVLPNDNKYKHIFKLITNP